MSGAGALSAPRWQHMAGWVGTALQLVGVFGLATRALDPFIAYQWMLAGSVAWVIYATRLKLWSAVALNAAFTASNVIGLWQWWA